MRLLPPEEGMEPIPPEENKSFWEDPAKLTDVMQIMFHYPDLYLRGGGSSQLYALEHSGAHLIYPSA